MFFYDPTFILLIPAILLSLWASFRVNSVFKKYARVPVSSRMTGARVAEEILRRAGIGSVGADGGGLAVQEGGGFLGDYYDPVKKKINLSSEVFRGTSISSVGVAAHESGHALQDAAGYAPLKLRSSLLPLANIGSMGAPFLFMMGFIFQSGASRIMMDIAILLFSAAVLFYLVTLPIEFDASRRAVQVLAAEGFITGEEVRGVREVLSAAAMTYVAAALMAILELIRFLILRGERD
ncbi:MAG: zinc metallopeptidase [bacterium]